VVEFADFGEDFGHPIGELIETMSGWTVRQRATEHLNESEETGACKKAIAFTIALALAANAKKNEMEKSDRHKVIRIETAPTT